jgi:hypothetical protein
VVGDDGGGYYRREGKSRSEGERGFVCCLVAAARNTYIYECGIPISPIRIKCACVKKSISESVLTSGDSSFFDYSCKN